jgi:hypothetical protein
MPFCRARVIQIPTLRWTGYDALRFNVKMDKKVPMFSLTLIDARAYGARSWAMPVAIAPRGCRRGSYVL